MSCRPLDVESFRNRARLPKGITRRKRAGYDESKKVSRTLLKRTSKLPGAAPATDHDEGSPRVVISGLNRTAFDLAIYASQGWLPTHHARLASGCWSGSTGRDWLPAGFHLKGFKLPTILLSRASWRDVGSFFVEKRTDTNYPVRVDLRST